MLEYDFTELDNDFVTIWSKYFLTHDESIIRDMLEALAELGQINSVQSYYLFNKYGENKYIDEIVDSYKGNSFNELWAMANNEDKNLTASECQKVLKLLKNEIDDYYKVDGFMPWHLTWDEFAKRVCKDVKYFRLKKSAIECAESIYETTNNVLVLQRIAEMQSAFDCSLPALRNDFGYYKCGTLYHNGDKTAKYARKFMLKEIKNIKDVNGLSEWAKNNPQLAYALGKNLITTNKGKHKTLGVKLLTMLSEREISKTLQDKIKEVENRKLLEKAEKQLEQNTETKQTTQKSSHQIQKETIKEIEQKEYEDAEDKAICEMFERLEKSGVDLKNIYLKNKNKDDGQSKE